MSLEYWSHTPEGLRLTREVPEGDMAIQVAKDKWLKQNLTPVSARGDLEAALDQLPKYALMEYSSPPSSPSLTSASSRSSLSLPPSPTSPFMSEAYPQALYEDCRMSSCYDGGSVLSFSASSDHYHEDHSDTTPTMALKYNKSRSPLRDVWQRYLEPLFTWSPHTTESEYHDSSSDLRSEYADSEDEKEVNDLLMNDLDTAPNHNAYFLPITIIHEPTSQPSHYWDPLLLLPQWLQTACKLFTIFS